MCKVAIKGNACVKRKKWKSGKARGDIRQQCESLTVSDGKRERRVKASQVAVYLRKVLQSCWGALGPKLGDEGVFQEWV